MPFGPIARNPSPRRAASPRVETLDPRQLLAAAVPSVVMLAASTADSQGVTISYDVATPRATPITLGFYRSADPTFDAGDLPVESVVALPAVDSSGAATGSAGSHTVTVPIPGGLPPSPERPYVLAVANPSSTDPADPPSTASFRTYTIGVITHGGIQNANSERKRDGVPWTHEMAKTLLAEGYDQVIPWNWVAASNSAGAAAKQGPKLAQAVLDASAQFPVGAPVNVHFIGHSEGAVVNAQAIIDASARQTPQLKAGYWEDTVLDPHAANPDFAGRQYSVSHGVLGTIAKLVIDNYQSRARDPIVTVPPRVDSSQVFYQQSAANRDHNSNAGMYNLWGEVPVAGATTYFDLTPSGITHGGKDGVYSWYQNFVAPTLGNGDAGLDDVKLTAVSSAGAGATTLTSATSAGNAVPRTTATTVSSHSTATSASAVPVADASTVTYSGTAQPGSTVQIRVAAPRSGHLRTVGTATAAVDGTWSTSTSSLRDGTYRVLATNRPVGPVVGKRPVIAVVPLGPLVVSKRAKD